MATVKMKFRASSVEKREGTLFFQVIHNRVARQISTGHRLFPSEWDAERGTVVVPEEGPRQRHDYVKAVSAALEAERARLLAVVAQLERSGVPFTADDVVERYLQASRKGGFLSFARRQIVHLDRTGRRAAAERLEYTLNSFVRFNGAADIALEAVDAELMETYEGWLRSQGLCMNTVSFYMRTLRRVYNVAAEQGLTAQRNPFRHVYTGIDKTVKRAVPLKVVREIRDLDLTQCPLKAFARDLFLFSFYTRGMSFVDMAYLKKKDLANGVLTYRRHKTNQQLTIRWEEPMREIVARYSTQSSPYLLPIIRNAEGDTRRQYRNALRLVNRKLKDIGRDIGLSMPLTTYVARHGWASIAHSRNIPVGTISEALGHDSERTTRIYLASLDTSAVDRANRQILGLLNKS